MPTPAECLDAAARIGDQLRADARWSTDRCTWHITREDPALRGHRQPDIARAGGGLYQGTAGIALFLLALWHETSDRRLLTTAEGALRHAIDDSASLPPLSFYCGRVGIAYALARHASLTGDDWSRLAACRLLARARADIPTDGHCDVIHGVAGAIAPLLVMRGWLGEPELGDVAREMGEHLIDHAERGAAGWSWRPPGRMGYGRNLSGFAHGAAGIGYALTELYADTGDDGHRYAAEQAFAYERSTYDPERGNWLDYRQLDVNYYLDGTWPAAEYRARLASGDLPSRAKWHGTVAWCHGAAGIGLTRLRAYEVLGHECYREEARTAVRCTCAHPDITRVTYSLCHGAGGNAELLGAAARAFEDPALAATASAWADQGLRMLASSNWHGKSGALTGYPDPSLMLGDAGVGYFYLRLAAPATPSVLLVTRPDEPRGPVVGHSRLEAMRADDVDRFWGQTLRVLTRLDCAPDAITTMGGRAGDSPVAVVDTFVRHRLCTADAEARVVLEDASRCDRAFVAAWLRPTELARAFLALAESIPVTGVDWERAWITLSSECEVVNTEWPWEAWLASEDAALPPPEEGAEFHLIAGFAGAAHRQPVTAFAGAVLLSVGAGGTLDDIVARMADVADVAADQLRAPVLEQLRLAYSAGVVLTEPASTSLA